MIHNAVSPRHPVKFSGIWLTNYIISASPQTVMPLVFIFPVKTASGRLNKKDELFSCLLNRITMFTQN